jgi:bifunctional DNA primase/polymerase-like protein/primase-like protein
VIQDPIARRKALAFAKRGYAVLPLHGIYDSRCTCGDAKCSSPGKHPRILHGVKDATTDPEFVSEWFDEHPDSNYGVCTDLLPTVDIDPRNGGDKAWRELVKKNWLPHTWEVVTGGGAHLIFGATSTPVPCGKLARGVDVKGVGGYVVGVGSRHQSGKRYRWAAYAKPKNTDLMAVPDWVLAMLTAPKERCIGPRSPEYYQRLIEPMLEGERNERMTTLLGHLYGSAFPDRVVLLKLALCFNRVEAHPPMSDDEVIRIACSIAKRQDRKGQA